MIDETNKELDAQGVIDLTAARPAEIRIDCQNGLGFGLLKPSRSDRADGFTVISPEKSGEKVKLNIIEANRSASKYVGLHPAQVASVINQAGGIVKIS